MLRNRTLWLALGLIAIIVIGGAAVYFFAIAPQQASSAGPGDASQPAVQPTTRPPTRTSAPTAEPTATTEPTTQPTEAGEMVDPTPTPPSEPLPAENAITPGNVNDIEEILSLEDHQGAVLSVAISPDNSLVASGGEDGILRVWRVADGSLLHTLEGHGRSIRAVEFSPDGQLLASGGDDRLVRIWQVDSGELVREIRSSLGGRVLDLEFHPDGDLLGIAGHFCYVELKNVDTGILRRTFIQPGCISKYSGSAEYLSIEFTQDGLELFTGDGQPGGTGGSVQRWDVETYTRPELVRGYDLVVRELALHPDEDTLAMALRASPEVWLLDLDSRQVERTLEGHQFRVNSVSYTPDGQLLVSGSTDRTVRIWNPENGAWLVTLEGHDDAINQLRISPRWQPDRDRFR